MIKNIIIFGTGKASYIHFLKYQLLGYTNIYFVNNNSDNRYNLNNIFPSLTSAMKENNVSNADTVIDICTPKSAFTKVIEECEKFGFKNIIVEKPFVVNNDYFANKSDLKILMIKNYDYSLLTNYAKNYISKNKLKITDIYTNFSKNRIDDSFSHRGMINENDIPTVFEVEMPHQIYLANYFKEMPKKEFIIVKALDMKKDNISLKKHGYGYISYKNRNIRVCHESDLTSNILQKTMSIVCNKNTVINISYCLYDKNIKMINKGIVEIISNGEINIKEFSEDDNVLLCLKEYINIFNNNLYTKKHQEDIIDFSKELTFYLNIIGN